MNYMDVYTPYSLLFMVVVTICIMLSALLIAYFTVMTKRKYLFWCYLFVQTGLLVWLCSKILELIAPVQEIMLMHLRFQIVGVCLLIPALVLFYIALRKRKTGKKLLLHMIIVGIAILTCAAGAVLTVPKWIFDYSPICAFLLWNGFIFHKRRSIFTELSEISIDAFMERAEDAILIFDRSGKLMDCNRNAKVIFPFINNEYTIDCFNNYLRLQIISGSIFSAAAENDAKPQEISLTYDGGTHYYMFAETELKNNKNLLIATILTFHNITEKTLLLAELEKKNLQLEELNGKLKDYIAVSHRLDVETEKNRAVMEIEETLGQHIAELLGDLETLEKTAQSESDDMIKEKLSQYIENGRSVMSDIRNTVESLTTYNEKEEK